MAAGYEGGGSEGEDGDVKIIAVVRVKRCA